MKNRNLRYSAEAKRDLDWIWDYIVFELQNSSAAELVVGSILDASDSLEDFAEMSAPLSSVVSVGRDYRYLVIREYMHFYRVTEADVYIDRILYGRRD